MPKASPIVTAFNAGEFSPLMAGRVDLPYYANGCRRLRNFVTTKQGAARRRPGTRFVAKVKTSADRTWLHRFEFNVEQSYVLEFGNLYIRFFSNHGVVGAPLEVTTPYTTADLTNDDGTFALRFIQSGDVLYITHPSYAPRKLLRTGAATFSLSVLQNDGGPFMDLDSAETRTVYASANTGTGITLTASAAIFLATHVGSLFYLQRRDVDNIQQWEAGIVTAIGDKRQSNGKYYVAATAGTTGLIAPQHTGGTMYDGSAGVQWTFLDAGYGWAKITAIGGGGTTATADVLSRIPDGAVGVGEASTNWTYGAWSDEEGWPDNVTFFRDRLCFTRNQEVWHSVTGDYENFRDRDEGGIVVADSAISSNITSDRSNRIEWVVPADTAMLIGTAGDESAMSEIASTEPLGPGNIRNKKQTEYGSRHVMPVRVGDGVVFAQKSGRKIREMMFSWEKEGHVAQDVTVLAEHVTKGGIIDMAYQQEPDSNVWMVRGDGALLGFTLDREQDVRGWHPHRIGGYIDANKTEYAAVESVITIAAPDGDRDELWMIVRRFINGSMVRYVEWCEYHHEEGDDPEDAFYLDSGLTLDNVKNATLTPGAGALTKGTTGVVFIAGSAIFAAGDVGRRIHFRYSTVDITGKVRWKTAVAEITQFNSNVNVTCTIKAAFPALTTIVANDWRMTTTTVGGLGHLIGQTVQIWMNGAAQPDQVVPASGSLTLDFQASKGHIGLACPAVLQPMPFEAGAADGTARGKTQRIPRCGIRFHETATCLYGRDEELDLDRFETRKPSDPMDEAPPLFTGVKTVSWPDGYDDIEGALVTIVADQAGPCTVVSLMPQVTTQDSR